MSEKRPRITVTRDPPWYKASAVVKIPECGDQKESLGDHAFTCVTTNGLLNTVADLVSRAYEDLKDQKTICNQESLQRMVKDKIIAGLQDIPQKPSLPLLLALLDLVEMENRGGFSCISDVDRAGIKDILLAYRNYMCFYIPVTKLVGTKGNIIVPVVTRYSEDHHFFYQDVVRSLVGTYTVSIPTSQSERGKMYFLQEALCTHGLQNLNVLKKIAHTRFEFWDLCLEVPTHRSAVTPSFQRIHPSQLLRTNNKNVPGCTANFSPMCCIVEQEWTRNAKHPRDIFTENKVLCNLSHFKYQDGNPRTVFLGQEKSSDRKKTQLHMVIAYKSQQQVSELYASTTSRFCRMVTFRYLKGHGGSVTFWSEMLRELARDTFMKGAEMHQDIYRIALSTFLKRVSPNAWHYSTPRHIKAMVPNPKMLQAIDLGVKLMENEIPNAFMVAELLCCPLNQVKEYAMFLSMYNSDYMFRERVHAARGQSIRHQIKIEWTLLTKMALSYAERVYNDNEESDKLKQFQQVFDPLNADNITKVQKFLCQFKSKDKEYVRVQTKTKLLLLKHRAHQKGPMTRTKLRKGRSSQQQTRRHGKNHGYPVTGKSVAISEEQSGSMLDMILPDVVPVSTWIKNLSALVLSEQWLQEEVVRKECICSLLGLNEKKQEQLLREWTIENPGPVKYLRLIGLQDTLSRTLITCLESIGSHKVYTQVTPTSKETLRMSKKTNLQEQSTLLSRKENQPSANKTLQHSKMMMHADKVYPPRNKTKQLDGKTDLRTAAILEVCHTEAKEATGLTEESDSENSECYEPPGEALSDTLEYDESESLDEYNLHDEFIDNRDTDELSEISENSSSPSGNLDLKTKYRKRKCTSGVNKRRGNLPSWEKVKRRITALISESETEGQGDTQDGRPTPTAHSYQDNSYHSDLNVQPMMATVTSDSDSGHDFQPDPCALRERHASHTNYRNKDPTEPSCQRTLVTPTRKASKGEHKKSTGGIRKKHITSTAPGDIDQSCEEDRATNKRAQRKRSAEGQAPWSAQEQDTKARKVKKTSKEKKHPAESQDQTQVLTLPHILPPNRKQSDVVGSAHDTEELRERGLSCGELDRIIPSSTSSSDEEPGFQETVNKLEKKLAEWSDQENYTEEDNYTISM